MSARRPRKRRAHERRSRERRVRAVLAPGAAPPDADFADPIDRDARVAIGTPRRVLKKGGRAPFGRSEPCFTWNGADVDGCAAREPAPNSPAAASPQTPTRRSPPSAIRRRRRYSGPSTIGIVRRTRDRIHTRWPFRAYSCEHRSACPHRCTRRRTPISGSGCVHPRSATRPSSF